MVSGKSLVPMLQLLHTMYEYWFSISDVHTMGANFINARSVAKLIIGVLSLEFQERKHLNRRIANDGDYKSLVWRKFTAGYSFVQFHCTVTLTKISVTL